MKQKLILCDLETKENNYSYNCPKISSDDWDELESPCDGCSHRCFKYVTVEE